MDRLEEILYHYQNRFCNKMCIIEVNYKKMGQIPIVFSETDLHHLLGLHKVTTNRAKKI